MKPDSTVHVKHNFLTNTWLICGTFCFKQTPWAKRGLLQQEHEQRNWFKIFLSAQPIKQQCCNPDKQPSYWKTLLGAAKYNFLVATTTLKSLLQVRLKESGPHHPSSLYHHFLSFLYCPLSDRTQYSPSKWIQIHLLDVNTLSGLMTFKSSISSQHLTSSVTERLTMQMYSSKNDLLSSVLPLIFFSLLHGVLLSSTEGHCQMHAFIKPHIYLCAISLPQESQIQKSFNTMGRLSPSYS